MTLDRDWSSRQGNFSVESQRLVYFMCTDLCLQTSLTNMCYMNKSLSETMLMLIGQITSCGSSLGEVLTIMQVNYIQQYNVWEAVNC